ncbi:hypothetical protein LJC72_02325 [Bacteroides sp. OttesenSCG-928-D19]|nr:hypothetical protein [Bacteroides sp. OttesenSCG-928-D19]
MKNVKFTLGLALSMLFMGATVSNAAYDNTAAHKGFIKTSYVVKASEYYAANAHTFGTNIDGGRWAFSGIASGRSHSFLGMTTIGRFWISNEADMESTISKKDKIYSTSNDWNYGGSWINPYAPSVGRTCDYYFDDNSKKYVGSGLFYEHKVDGGFAKNHTWVALKMVEGLDVMPVIKRTITYGEWVYNADKDVNELKSTKVAPIIETLDQTFSGFRPYYDRENGIAVFYFEEDILSLMEKHIIYSIDYEISVNEIVGMPDGTEGGPINSDVTVMRAVDITAESGIMTTPSALAGTHYTPSNKNFTFTVHSAKNITVSTDRGRDEEGVKIKDNKNGTYTVTIIKVQQDLKITIKSVSTESGEGGEGQTGTEVIAKDKVWAANGTLYVEAINPATMSVYTVTGQLYKQIPVTGSYSASLPKGLYIVQLNGKAYKVVL